MPLLTIAVSPTPDRVVVHLSGEADLSAVPRLTAELRVAADAGDPVEVDVAEVHFGDTSCLRALSVFRADLGATGRTCQLVGLSPRTRRLLWLAGREELLSGP